MYIIIVLTQTVIYSQVRWTDSTDIHKMSKKLSVVLEYILELDSEEGQ